jgi:hypothetical protein
MMLLKATFRWTTQCILNSGLTVTPLQSHVILSGDRFLKNVRLFKVVFVLNVGHASAKVGRCVPVTAET